MGLLDLGGHLGRQGDLSTSGLGHVAQQITVDGLVALLVEGRQVVGRLACVGLDVLLSTSVSVLLVLGLPLL